MITRPSYRIFFGNKNLTQNIITTSFPKACWLNQVHGRDILDSSFSKQTADGHYTQKINRPLIIKTADCMPVFYKSNQAIMALHIGWRSLLKNILSHAAETHPPTGDSELFVGPHIQMESFDLDENNFLQLLKSHGLNIKNLNRGELFIPSPNKEKHYLVNLSFILSLEAKKIGFKKITISPANTYTSMEHYSFRRNRFEILRNFSFIEKIESKNIIK